MNDDDEPEGLISSSEPEPAELREPPKESRALVPIPQVEKPAPTYQKAASTPDINQLLPQSLDGEKSVLSSFLIDPRPVGTICREKGLNGAFFFLPHHAEIFETLMEMWEAGEPIDLTLLTIKLHSRNRLEACGGGYFITELHTFLPTAVNVRYYINVLFEKRALRSSIIDLTRLTARCYNEQDAVWEITEEARTCTAKNADLGLEVQGVESGVEVLGINELLAYDTTNNPDTIVGRHWLMKGGSALWIGPSGIGKSSLAMQVAVHLAMGIPIFGITPVRPLKSVIVQAENDVGDLAEMAQGVMKQIEATHALTPAMRELLAKNLVLIRDTKSFGADFATMARRIIRKHSPDLFWADPLLSYVGDDISKQSVASEFLRNRLNPIAAETGVCFCMMHHTGKPATDPKARGHWQESDMSYIAFGSSELTNWARAINVLRPLGDGNFELHLVKRGKRAMAKDLDGNFTDKIYLRHSDTGIAWEQIAKPEEPDEEGKNGTNGSKATSTQYEAKHEKGGKNLIRARLMEISPDGEGRWKQADLKRVVAKLEGCSERMVGTYINEMADEGEVIKHDGLRLSLARPPLPPPELPFDGHE